MFLPPNETVYGVKFYKGTILVCLRGYASSESVDCITQGDVPQYSCNCLSHTKYTLTIPAETLTYKEQGSIWRCEYFNSPTNFSSREVTLYIASKIYHIIDLSINVNGSIKSFL